MSWPVRLPFPPGPDPCATTPLAGVCESSAHGGTEVPISLAAAGKLRVLGAAPGRVAVTTDVDPLLHATSGAHRREVAKRVEPWTFFARAAIAGVLTDSHLRSIVPADSVGIGVVARYPGMEMLTQLDGDRAPAAALFDQAMRLATLFGGMGDTP